MMDQTEMNAELFDAQQRLKKEATSNPYMILNGIEIEQLRTDYVRLAVTLRPELCNPYGRAHGGLLYTMADCCGGITARTNGHDYVTLNANIHYLSNVTEGRLIAESHLISRTRKLCVVGVDIHTDQGQKLIEATVTMYCVS